MAQLRETRHRLRGLTENLSSAELMGPRLDIVNPALWEIGHVAWFHEYWTLRHAHGQAPLIERADRLWDSSHVPHATRWQLDLPDRAGTFSYMADVLARQEDRLGGTIDGALEDSARYFYELALRHEDMHVEALAYSRQTLSYPPPPALGASRAAPAGDLEGDVAVPGGAWRMGARPGDGFVFDNEKGTQETMLAPFRIARAPVTNTHFAAFIEGGGYGAREFWSAAGWAWRQQRNAERPVYWQAKRDGVWTVRRYSEIEPLAPHAPVVFVTWFEAEAWCRWAGRRLPSEAEWEAAAIGEPTPDKTRLADTRRRWPWGEAPPSPAHANLDFAFDGPVDVAACAAGDSAFGCRQMTGNVWQWTASDFLPFAGFSADPYVDYSQPWFGTRKVLRGGCWASSARVARPVYRNFFTPDRCDVVAGFRTCAL